MKRLVLALVASAAAVTAYAQQPSSDRTGQTYAQFLAAGAVNPATRVMGVAMHVIKPKSSQPTVIASSLGDAAGKLADVDLAAFNSGSAAVTSKGGTADVRLPLLDTSQRKVGVLDVRLRARPDEGDAALIARATKERDRLARRISHVDNLLEGARFDATTPTNSYMQHLVDRAFDAHPEIIILMAHVTPEGAPNSANVVVGSTIGRIGKRADEDDLKVIDGGITKLEVNESGDRYEVEAPLLNTAGVRIGALGAVFPYVKGQDTTRYQVIAKQVQAELARRLLHNNNAFEHWPYDPAFSDNTHAQAIVERMMQAHPDLRVFALHATPPGSQQNVIIASNIGRIGKQADADDLAIIHSGKTIVEVNKTGDLLEVALVLHDAAGKNIGALGEVFPYKPSDDKAAREREAVQIRDEMARLIASNAALFEPAHGTPITAPAAAAGDAVLKPRGGVDIPNYAGDFDHFAIDTQGDRLFLAGEEGKTLEVFKLSSGERLKTLTNVEVPHSLLYMPQRDELLVLDGGPGGSYVLDGKTYEVVRKVKLPLEGADSIGYDAPNNRLWVVSGGKDVPLEYSNLTEIDPTDGKVFHNIRFEANHVEAMAVEQGGDKLFINVTDKNYLAVVDRKKGTVAAQWPIKEAEQNAPLAFDEKHHRLFVVTRKPGKLIVVNADTGATVASFKAPERTDQVVWDEGNRRVYVTGGEGCIGVVQQDDADHYTQLADVPSAPGAKTAILAPGINVLYVAVSPGESGAMGRVISYDVAARP